MRYQLKSQNDKNTIFKIIDTKPVESWDDDVATIWQLKGSKINRPKLVVDSLNLMNDLKHKPENKTKKELLEIIKKYI